MSAPRRAVYTALIGRYEMLHEQPLATTSDLPFICLTDDPDLVSETWDVRLVEPRFPMDPIRSARELKIVGSPQVDGYDETLWVDARVVLRTDPGEILDSWLAEADVAIPRHSYRKDVVTEFEEVLLGGFDEHARLYEQLSHYAAIAPEELEAPVPWTGIIARRHTSQVRAAMEHWFLDLVRYSRRDQLSVRRALSAAGIEENSVEIDSWGSDVHTWMDAVGRDGRPAVFRLSSSLQPPVARLGELRHELETTVRRLNEALAHREEALVAQEERSARLWERNQALRARNEKLKARVAALRVRVERLRAQAAPPRRSLPARVVGRLRRARSR